MATATEQDEGNCAGGIPGIEQLCDGAEAVGGAASDVVGAVTGAPGAVAGAVGEGIFNQLTKWMTDAAQWVTSKIQKLIDKTSTPELTADWYKDRFGAMVALGGGLSVLVAMIALASAGLRRDPDALGATFIGMFRAGIGTGIVLALVVLALGVADGITNWVATDASGKTASKFWGDVAGAWGKDASDSFGSSAIAFLFAVIQVIAGIAVWIEMLLRQAGIYVAVLFMPAALAASIWPPLRAWQSRLVALLFVLIAMKPVIVVVLSLAGSAAAAGGDADKDLGVLIAAVMILVLAAFVPWVLMMLVSMDHQGSWSASQATGSMKGAVGGGLGRVGGTLSAGASKLGGGSRGGGGRSAGGGLGGGSRGPAGAGGGGALGGGGGGGGSRRGSGGGSRAGGSPGGRSSPGGGSSGGQLGGGRPAPAGTVAAAAGLDGGGRSGGAAGRGGARPTGAGQHRSEQRARSGRVVAGGARTARSTAARTGRARAGESMRRSSDGG